MADPGKSDLARVFCRIDADGDGRITPAELAAVSRAVDSPGREGASGSSTVAREAEAMVAAMDTNHDGVVDMGEYVAFNSEERSRRELEEEVKAAFDAYDVDGDGRISAGELRSVLCRILGEKIGAKEVQRMIKAFDADGDGCVGFEEFKKMMAAPPHK